MVVEHYRYGEYDWEDRLGLAVFGEVVYVRCLLWYFAYWMDCSYYSKERREELKGSGNRQVWAHSG